MPRIRTIKPDFWTDEKIVELTPWARLFYIGLWNFSDDNGVVENKPRQLKIRIFPADDIKIEPLIEELAAQHLIEVYEVDGEKYLICRNLRKHQVIDSPRKSNLPLPPQIDINRNQLKSTEILNGREGKGREGKRKGKEGKEPPPETAGPQPAFSCLCFEVTPDHLADLVRQHPEFPEPYLLGEFFPRMADWCLDHRDDAQHRKKFDGGGRLKNPRSCLRNWLKREDPAKAVAYLPRPQPHPAPPPDPPGLQTVWDPNCSRCRGGGWDRDGPCACGKLEPIVDPDPACPKCRGRGMTDAGLCDCFRPRGPDGNQKKPAVSAPPGTA
jgi:hypothetical protein